VENLGYFKTILLNFKEHFENRTQVVRLAIADLKKTYNGSALGWAWAVIKPVFTIFVYWFAVSIGLRNGKDVGEYPYLLWLVAGLISWFFMSEAILGGTTCIRRYSYLVTKMKYPIMTIPTFTNLALLVVHVVLIIAVVILYWIMGYPPTIYLLQLPLYTVFMFMFFNAWGLFAGMVSCISKDFSNLIKSINIGFFWFSGIIWNIENIADRKLISAFMSVNPITFIAYGYRDCFVYHKWFFEEPFELIVFLVEYAFIAFLSIWAYRKLRKEIPDVL
jgi:teichoic acid transport system permease protein